MEDNANTGRDNAGSGNAGNRNAGNWNAGRDNTGSWNAGSGNAGNRNAGSGNAGRDNAGNRNAGSGNTGNRNAGDWNAGDWNAGHFNSTTPDEIRCFNKPISREVWESARKPGWLYVPRPATWVDPEDMTAKEKEENPGYETCGGYLRKNDMAQEWREALASASKEDIQAVRNLPNFDAEVFEAITGLDLTVKGETTSAKRTIVIDGITYELKAID